MIPDIGGGVFVEYAKRLRIILCIFVVINKNDCIYDCIRFY